MSSKSKPNFKSNNPNETLLPHQNSNIESNNAAVDDTEKNPTPKAPKQEKKKSEYLRLDVTDYKDYISLMAEHTSNTTGKYVSMTQYILRLIEADKQKNLETYEKLEQIERMKRELM